MRLFDKRNSLNPMIGILCVAIATIILPATDPIPGTSQSQRFARFDYLGSVLFTAAITCAVMAISFGGALFSWSSGAIIALFVVAAVLIIAFGVQQVFLILTRLEDRIFPVQFVGNYNAVLLFISTAAINTSCFIRKYFPGHAHHLHAETKKPSTTSQFTCKYSVYRQCSSNCTHSCKSQFTRGDGALESAVRLLPLIIILATVIFVNGQVITRWGYFQDWYIIGGFLLLIGGVLMCKSLPLSYIAQQAKLTYFQHESLPRLPRPLSMATKYCWRLEQDLVFKLDIPSFTALSSPRKVLTVSAGSVLVSD